MCRSSSKIESNKEQDFGLDDSLLIERSLKGDLIIRGYNITKFQSCDRAQILYP